MALTTTGSDANAYITISEADSYWSDRDNDTWGNLSGDTSAKEAAIIEATQYIDAKFGDRFVGYIRTTSQSLEWPRASAVDRSGRTLNDIPKPVKDACAELALAAIEERLVPVEERGGRIKRTVEQVGPLREETEYMDGAPSGRTYRFAEMLLESVLNSRGQRLTRV